MATPTPNVRFNLRTLARPAQGRTTDRWSLLQLLWHLGYSFGTLKRRMISLGVTCAIIQVLHAITPAKNEGMFTASTDCVTGNLQKQGSLNRLGLAKHGIGPPTSVFFNIYSSY